MSYLTMPPCLVRKPSLSGPCKLSLLGTNTLDVLKLSINEMSGLFQCYHTQSQQHERAHLFGDAITGNTIVAFCNDVSHESIKTDRI
jgi:hypothetical protein